ncbi:MAG: sensor domain-containing diguanylate cyclase [Lachnospiraceae bacterium]|nr:sensor domain-containing diguanylate cyclase [Lachnospiraceae bacterium]MBR6150856.1 sensor domain-containing diguanylate cyclase [Lachnospiraceae bacterium]
MDFRGVLDSYSCKACVMSVELYPDGKYGNIRVAAGNEAHAREIQMVRGYAFEEGMPYEACFPKNLNFEDFCYRSAALHQQLHSYVDLFEMGLWLEMYLLPLESDQEGIGYCLYSYNVAPKADTGVMTDVAPEVSSAVLASCIKLHGTEDFETCIHEVIDDIRSICDARRCCLLLLDEEARDCYVLVDSQREGYVASRSGESMNKSFYDTVETWKTTIGGSTCLIIKNEQDMQVIQERNPLWYQSLKKATVDTLVLFPLKYNGRLVGYVWASNFDVENAVKIKGVLELATFFIASRIANYQLVKRLEVLGTIDLLTGSKNRNAMNNRVAEFETPEFHKPKSLGVVFLDLNGLKMKNDKEGHDSGDRLLKKSVAVLQQVFVDEEIYRAGGDEFMILVFDCTEQYLLDRIARLRRICEEDQEVSFSIGYCMDEGEMDIRRDMSEADRLMYEDKEKYYQKYPDRKYR